MRKLKNCQAIIYHSPHDSASITRDNGERFTLLCIFNDVSLDNTFFKNEDLNKTT